MRVGIVDYLNSRPLAWAFREGSETGGFEPIHLPPAQVATELAMGSLDVGLIPSIEVQRIPGLHLVPGLCIAATHEVRSVLLVSKVPPRQIRRLALDENSRTSAALVRILLSDRFGVQLVAEVSYVDPISVLSIAWIAIINDPFIVIVSDIDAVGSVGMRRGTGSHRDGLSAIDDSIVNASNRERF